MDIPPELTTLPIHPTPLVDAVLTDSLAIPPGVDRWLREAERSARRLRAELEEVETRFVRIDRLDSVLREMVDFIEDEQKSPFRRLLRRPLSQVGPGSPAARSFDGHVGRLFQQAEEVLEAQRGAEEAAERLAELLARYARRMPYSAAAALARARIDAGGIVRIRRSSDARGLWRQIARAEDALAKLARQLPYAEEDDRLLPLGGGGSIGTAELWAALQLKLRERESASSGNGRTAKLRLLQARHVRGLGHAGGWNRPGERPEHVIAEHLGDVSLRAGSARSKGGPTVGDSDLWGALLGAAERARFPDEDAEHWQPRVSTPPAEATPLTEPEATTLYVIPIVDGFVYISNEHPSAVRLWSRAAGEGDVVEAMVFGGREPVPANRLRTDVQPLFSGAEAGDSGWYATDSRASLRVLARYRNGWFAVLELPGVLRRLRAPAFVVPEKPTSAMRVLDGATGADRVMTVGPMEVPPQTVFGIVTHEVRTPIEGHETAWLRCAAGAAADALDREHTLVRALRARSPALTMTPLGRGRMMNDGPEGYLYAPPLGITTDTPVAADWLASSPRATVGAVLRSVERVHEAGFALGIHHPDSYVFGMERSVDVVGGLRPRAILVVAPYAVRFGHAFESPTPEQRRHPPAYPRLGFQGFPPAVMTGEVALPALDAVGLALMCLEIVVDPPLPAMGEGGSWTGLTERVRKHASHFPDAAWGREVARAMATGNPGAELLDLIRSVAE